VTRFAVVAAMLLIAAPTAEAGLTADARRESQRKASVELHVYPAVVGITQVPRAVFINTGDLLDETGYGYRLERRTMSSWRWINRGQGVPAVLVFVEPGASTRPERVGIWRVNPAARCQHSPEPCCIRVPLSPGLYRVTKGAVVAKGAGRGDRLVARAKFRVVTGRAGTRPETVY
jgi:hypothetical protein